MRVIQKLITFSFIFLDANTFLSSFFFLTFFIFILFNLVTKSVVHFANIKINYYCCSIYQITEKRLFKIFCMLVQQNNKEISILCF